VPFLGVQHDHVAWSDRAAVAAVGGRGQAALGERDEVFTVRVRAERELADRCPEQLQAAEIRASPRSGGARFAGTGHAVHQI
jgi:hypothetical protein